MNLRRRYNIKQAGRMLSIRRSDLQALKPAKTLDGGVTVAKKKAAKKVAKKAPAKKVAKKKVAKKKVAKKAKCCCK